MLRTKPCKHTTWIHVEMMWKRPFKKRAFEAKENAIFKDISIAKNCLRPESVPLINIQKHDRIAWSCSLS